MPQSKSKRSRYTPPPPKKAPPSPLWVPVVMATMFVMSVVVIIGNYLGALPGDGENSYLMLGLVLMIGGFLLATTYR